MPFQRSAALAIVFALALPVSGADDIPAATPEPAAGPVVGQRFTVPAGTELVFEMGEAVSSKTSQRGDRFPLRLAEPVRIDGHLVIPAGTPAMGEVVHADRARAGGQPGELILAARYLEWDGRQLPLSAFRAGVGKSHSNAAMGVALAAGLAGFLVRGGQVEMPAGSLISARLREAAELPGVPEPAAHEAIPAPAATESHVPTEATNTTQATTGENQE